MINRKKCMVCTLVIILITLIAPLKVQAANAANYNNDNIDYNDYYSDWLGAGYANSCDYKEINPSIEFIDSRGTAVSSNEVDGKTYVPNGTKVKLSWKLDESSGFAAAKLSIWQYSKDPDFGEVTKYNFGSTGIYRLRGSASGLIGDIESKNSKGRFEHIYSISEYNKIDFLCESIQIHGDAGGSAAVGSVMGNVTRYYYYKNDRLKVIEDSTKPDVTLTVNATPTNNWYPIGTTVTVSASDTGSGIKMLIVNGEAKSNPYTYSLLEGTNNITYSAEDNAGNSTGNKSQTVYVDGTAPTISVTPSQNVTSSGWYKGETNVTFNASDAQSGLAWINVNSASVSNGYVVNAAEGITTYSYQAGDLAGNSSEIKNITLSVDTTKPTATISGGVSNWTNQDVALKISGKDAQSGLASMIIEYSADHANWITYAAKNYSNVTDTRYETIFASKNGYYRLKSVDAVGYETISNEIVTITKIDKEKPTIVATVTGDEGIPVDNWYKKSAKIKIVAFDTGGSGLKQLFYGDKVTTVNTVELPTVIENKNIFTYSAEDKAGNTTGDLETDIYVDSSAPIDLEWSSNQSIWTNQDITVTMNARDIYSGLKKFVVQKKNIATNEWEDYTETNASYETKLTTKTALIKENGIYRFKAADRVGYETIIDQNKYIVINMIDKEKPVVTPTEIGTKSTNGWYKDSVNLKLYAEDFGVSGLKTLNSKIGNTVSKTSIENKQIMTTFRTAVIDTEGSTTATYFADDWAGNRSNTGTSILKVDKTTPKDVTVSADTSTWTNTSVAVTAKATDIMSGLDKIIIQKFDIDTWKDYQTQNFNGETTEQLTTFAIGENGIYRIKAIDKVGFEMTSDLSMGGSEVTTPKEDDPKPGIIIVVKIDKTKPTITEEINNIDSYKDISNGWYREDVILKLKAEDDASGVGSITCNLDIFENTSKSKTYTRDYTPFQAGKNIFQYIATDVAGNQSDEGTTELNVDSILPEQLSIEKITTGWVSKDTGVTIRCKGQDKESGLYQFVLEKSEDGVNNWTEKVTYNYIGETTLQELDMITDENGYYRLAVCDRVLHKSVTSDIIHVDNIDDTKPVSASLTISPDTTEWVNEPTGVDLTATGQDTASGISELSVMQKNDVTDQFESIYKENFNGETTLLDTECITHVNGKYKTSAVDAVGNDNVMPDEDALEVPNIDPVNPTLTVKADALIWASAERGYPIYVYAKDEESGLNSIKLQSYEEETNTWIDTNTNYTIENYVKGEESLSKYEGNMLQNFVNGFRLGFNKVFFKQKTIQEAQFKENGTNEMVKAVFKVYNNRTYRVVADDIVANTTSSQEVVVTTMDFDKPSIMVEGNPTDWTNQTATIKVTAKDADSKIAKMILNGKSVDFKEKDNAFFFTFDVVKNADYVVAAYDQAGNYINQEVKVTKIDKENPCITSSISDWKKGSATASIELYDDLSGIKSAYMNEVMIDIPNDKHTSYSKDIKAEVSYYVSITDRAGNIMVQSISENKALAKLKVTTPPDKTKYKVKEKFKKKGMVVTAYYTDGSSQVVEDYMILNGNSMTVNQDKINVKYTERGITKDANTPVTVETTSNEPPEPTLPDLPDTPVLPIKPVIPKKPVVPIVDLDEPVMKEEGLELPKAKENIVPEVTESLPEPVKEKSFPLAAIIGGAAAGAGIMFFFFFMLFTNIKVYSKNEKGDYKLIGRTRARSKRDKIFIKTNVLMIIFATSGEFKFVFSKGYAKTHGDSDVLVRIEKSEFEKYLAKGEDTIYVEYEG